MVVGQRRVGRHYRGQLLGDLHDVMAAGIAMQVTVLYLILGTLFGLVLS